jgi:hypothetical protein
MSYEEYWSDCEYDRDERSFKTLTDRTIQDIAQKYEFADSPEVLEFAREIIDAVSEANNQ